MKSSGIGGQAVIEGVMMKNGGKYAVAVRKPDGEITVETHSCKTPEDRPAFLKLPFVRGVVAFVDSLSIGMGTLTSSSAYFVEEEETSEFEKKLDKLTKGKADKVLNILTVFISVILALAIFVALPMFVSTLLENVVESGALLALLEGIIRVIVFILYIVLISQMSDIKRMFMYHGAEHKAINCIENGRALTVRNVRNASKKHKRCGTSFMLNVMILSILFFMVIRVDNIVLKLVLRLVLIPVIAGVAYEFIRLAGNSDNKIVNFLSKPGLLMQALTTREPDDKMIEVAIASVEAVFDWKTYLDENGSKKKKHGQSKNSDKKAETKTDKKVEAAPVDVVLPVEPEVVMPDLKGKVNPVETAAPEVTEEKPVAPENAGPLEVDISQLFDIKLPQSTDSGKKKKQRGGEDRTAPVSTVSRIEDDAILSKLDFMFQYNGPKTVTEISDDVKSETEDVTEKTEGTETVAPVEASEETKA